MNHTPNYNLPQWVASDRIRMDDFNSAMSNIEAGMSANASAAQSAAEKAAEKPYAIGTYVGNTEPFQSVDVGFTPSFVIISGRDATNKMEDFDSAYYSAATGAKRFHDRIVFTLFGFAVMAPNSRGDSYPNLNEPGVTYEFIAFR